MAKPVLNLDTLVERRAVRIDGVDHELRNVGEFSILTYHQISARAERVKALAEAPGDATDDVAAELARHLDWLCRIVLVAPDEVHVRLGDAHRLAIIQSFSSLQREKATTAPAEGSRTRPSIGASTSRGSSASTAGRRSTGSPRSRRR